MGGSITRASQQSVAVGGRLGLPLRRKLLLILAAVIGCYILIEYALFRLVVFPSYIDLERAEADEDMERCVAALQREIHHLAKFTHDWAMWDDTYEFVVDGNDAYRESNLGSETFSQSDLNLLFILDSDGRAVFSEARNSGGPALIELPELPATRLPADHPLLRLPTVESAVSGIVLTSHGPVLLASMPIVTSRNEGPIRGALIMGRFLDRARLEALETQTLVHFQVTPIGAGLEDPDLGAGSVGLPGIGEGSRFLEAGETLRVFRAFPDVAGAPALLIEARIPRQMVHRAYQAAQLAISSIVVAGLTILVLLVLLLKGAIVDPLLALRQHAHAIRQSGDLSRRMASRRGDEIGMLSGEFDLLLERLEAQAHGLELRVQERTSELSRLKEQLEIRVDERTVELRHALHQQALLLREIHHRVKNNLQIVSSLLSLEAHRPAAADLADRYSESQRRVEAMALVHEKMYRSDSVARLDFGDYVEDLAVGLFQALGVGADRVQLVLQVEHLPLDIDTAIPLGLIISELVSNALKHAFPGNASGRVSVRFGHGGPRGYELEVSDDGVGMAADCGERRGTTLGLTLVSRLVEQLDGSCECVGGKGSTFRISFAAPSVDEPAEP